MRVDLRRWVIVNEECDDGNTNNNDGCSSTCKVEPGYQCAQPASSADGGFNDLPSVCEPICGDGVVVPVNSATMELRTTWAATISVARIVCSVPIVATASSMDLRTATTARTRRLRSHFRLRSWLQAAGPLW